MASVHTEKSIITDITKSNLREKMEDHYSKIEKYIELYNLENLKITSKIEHHDNKDAVMTTIITKR